MQSWPELRVARISQEVGVVVSDKPLPFAELPVGTLLRIIPCHSCVSWQSRGLPRRSFAVCAQMFGGVQL